MSSEFKKNWKKMSGKGEALTLGQIMSISDVGSFAMSTAVGSFVPDNQPTKTIVTGLSSPIKYLKLFVIGQDFTSEKTIDLTGRNAVHTQLQGSLYEFLSTPVYTAIGFVNDSKDFDVKNNDDVAINSLTSSTVYWIAMG